MKKSYGHSWPSCLSVDFLGSIFNSKNLMKEQFHLQASPFCVELTLVLILHLEPGSGGVSSPTALGFSPTCQSCSGESGHQDTAPAMYRTAHLKCTNSVAVTSVEFFMALPPWPLTAHSGQLDGEVEAQIEKCHSMLYEADSRAVSAFNRN